MPIFGDALGPGVSFYDFSWEGWSNWIATQQSGTTPPPPVFWDTKDGCREKFQMVEIFPEPLET